MAVPKIRLTFAPENEGQRPLATHWQPCDEALLQWLQIRHEKEGKLPRPVSTLPETPRRECTPFPHKRRKEKERREDV
ncbi:MAG: hypothetical protein KBT39_02015 [Bacteroidales bacterium]|nr:hypothetical protein [Bacteroidales bacterium]